MSDQSEATPLFNPPGNDPFFVLPEVSVWNGCIGRQADDENYLDGYIEAAIDLAEVTLEKARLERRDSIIMPILYNARHAVELTLKLVLDRLHRAGSVNEGARANHLIGAMWRALQDANVGDQTLRSALKDLGPYITSLDAIDDDGQALRYAVRQPRDRPAETSMGDRALANLEVIHRGLVRLKEILETLKFRANDLLSEVSTGTFTRECSRLDLYGIARRLPPHEKWGNAEFRDAKETLRVAFNLSRGAMDRAIGAIRGQRELRGSLGIETPLIYIDADKAQVIFGQWLRLHPPRPTPLTQAPFPIVAAATLGEQVFANIKVEQEVNQFLRSLLTGDDLAELETAYYYGREGKACEFYEHDLDLARKQFQRREHRHKRLHDLLNKANLLQAFRKGSQMLGALTLVRHLDEMQTS